MIIGLDATALAGKKTGIGIYTDQLIKALLNDYPEVIVKLFSCKPVSPDNSRQVRLSRNAWKSLPYPGVPPTILYSLWSFLKYPPIELLTGEIDIFHGLSYVLPPTKKARTVLTIHDLAFMRIPEVHTRLRVILTPQFVRKSVARADAILAVSEHTKNDIVDLFNVDPSKITVTYNGVDHRLFHPQQDSLFIEKVMRQYGIIKPYVYYLGTIEPRKNVDILVKAFVYVNEKLGGNFQLVLTGKKGWKVDALMQDITKMAETRDLVYTGYVTDEEKAALYNGAELFVYPSQYEGFGIPVVEAMACGCPVITTNVSSLPEVAGTAGILVPPGDLDALADGIIKILCDQDLRKRMSEASLIQAAEFTWQRTAAVTKSVYEKLL